MYWTFVDMLQVLYDLCWIYAVGIRGRGKSVMCTTSTVMPKICSSVFKFCYVANFCHFWNAMYLAYRFYLQPVHKHGIVFAALISFRTFSVISGCCWQRRSHPVCGSVFQSRKWNYNPCWVSFFFQNMKASIKCGAFLDSLLMWNRWIETWL